MLSISHAKITYPDYADGCSVVVVGAGPFDRSRTIVAVCTPFCLRYLFE